MRILFMGTDEFAVPTLETLAEKYQVVAVITRPEKPKGRGLKVTPTPVKEAAERLGIPVMEPKNLKRDTFKNALGQLQYDIVVLVSYGRVLPEEFIEKPQQGCICVHPSLLPEYRGCSPIESAILDGKDRTGISIFYIEKDIDTGAVIYKREFPIDSEDTGGSLRSRLSRESPDVLLEALRRIEGGAQNSESQPSGDFPYAPKFCKDDARINWNLPAESVNNAIRAFNPKPGAYTCYRGKVLKIHKGMVLPHTGDETPGTIIDIDKDKGITVACGKDKMLLLEVQLEGKKVLCIRDFILGYRPEVGERMGIPDEKSTGDSQVDSSGSCTPCEGILSGDNPEESSCIPVIILDKK